MLETIAPPFWHPAVKGAFILDWDGVLADTKLDFSALRQRYFCLLYTSPSPRDTR